MYSSDIAETIEQWARRYTGDDKLNDLQSFLLDQFPEMQFEVERETVTLGALIGSTSLEVKNRATMKHLDELMRDINGYLVFSKQLIVLFIDTEDDIVARFRSYLDDKERTRIVRVVEI